MGPATPLWRNAKTRFTALIWWIALWPCGFIATVIAVTPNSALNCNGWLLSARADCMFRPPSARVTVKPYSTLMGSRSTCCHGCRAKRSTHCSPMQRPAPAARFSTRLGRIWPACTTFQMLGNRTLLSPDAPGTSMGCWAKRQYGTGFGTTPP